LCLFFSRIFPSDFFSDAGTEFLEDYYNSLVGEELAKIANFMGTPLPPPLPIGIIELQARTLKIFEFKGLIGKIFWIKELAWLPAEFDSPSLVPATGNQSLSRGLFLQIISSLSKY